MNDQTAEKRIEWLITQLEGRELQYKTFKRDRDEITLALGDTRALVDTYKALKEENARLRKDIEHLRKIVKAATEYANAHFYAEPQWKLNRLFEDMCTAMDTPQPKEDKQS